MTSEELIASIFKDVTLLLGELAWPTLCGLALYLFRKNVSSLISRIRSVSRDGSKVDVLFEDTDAPNKKSLPSGNDVIFRPDDVKVILKSCPAVDKKEIDTHYVRAYELFRRSGIVTSAQLRALVTAPEVIDTLTELYVKLLKRDDEHPLDPVGLAAYGSVLFNHGNKADIVEAIIQRIGNSPEFRAKHPKQSVQNVMRDILKNG